MDMTHTYMPRRAMVRSLLLACFGVVVATAGWPIWPAQAGPYTALFAFGDSLSDAGNVFLATGGFKPAPPYVGGHFSNGPTWVENLSLSLGLGPLTPSLAGGNDFAFGGAVTGSSVPGASTAVPSIAQQVGQFVAATGGPGNAVPTGLYTVWIGANDVLQAVSDIATATIDPTTAAADLASAAEAAANAIDALAMDGATTFLVPTLPDLGLTPGLNTTPLASLGTALAAGYNANLLADLGQVATADGVTISTIDIFTLLEKLVANPSAGGYTNVTDACFTGTLSSGGTPCATPNQYLFWDSAHPTERGHEAVAEAALAAVVPEPGTLAILAGGLAGLWLLRRRGHGHTGAALSKPCDTSSLLRSCFGEHRQSEHSRA
jgi:phospholipase/lecithinase/hemolysin